VPLYLTEYGYQTKPDPTGVSFERQAAWINQAEYIAYKNPNVRAMSQFLLVDDGPVPDVDPAKDPRLAWRTFQSGLVLLAGKRKQSYKAYMTPIFVKQQRIPSGRSVGVFGMLRGAKAGTRRRVQIQWRRKRAKRWSTRKTVRADGARNYLETRVRVPASGSLRLRWHNGRRALVSRSVAVVVVRRR
jgi:hypothetical protein